MDTKITKPVGHNSICKYIDEYIPHMVIPLSKHSGRTTLIKYLRDKYKQSGILPFDSGLEDYLEIEFDGSLSQLKQSFTKINSEAIYKNHYTGIISFDISMLSQYINDIQGDTFFKEIKIIAQYANCVFFTNEFPSKSEERLTKGIISVLGGSNVVIFDSDPYSCGELASIMINRMRELGIELKSERNVLALLKSAIPVYEINDLQQAIIATDTIIRNIDYTDSMPIIDEHNIKKILSININQRSGVYAK